MAASAANINNFHFKIKQMYFLRLKCTKYFAVISTSPLFSAINFLYTTVYEMVDMRLFSELAHNLK